MIGVAAHYPKFDEDKGSIINLELLINEMRNKYMNAEPYKYESDEMLSLTAFITYQSYGYPIEVSINGPSLKFFNAGKDFYFKRRGQLNLACNQCHDKLVGEKIRGDTISQGQIDDFPIFRLMWQSLASRHRMFSWCNSALRAEPFELGSEEFLNLELYIAWRGRGLSVQSPGVRR